MHEGLPQKHGILVLHGAGTPEDQEGLVGDPLSRSANGLIDHLNGDEFLKGGRRITVSTGSEGADLEKRVVRYLDVDIFHDGDPGRPGEHKHKIRMREVLWKPTMPKQPLGTYLGVLWGWAFAFRSHNLRKTRFEEQDTCARERRQGVVEGHAHSDHEEKDWKTDWDQNGVGIIEEELGEERRQLDFQGRILLACLGLLSSFWWALVVGEVMKKWWEVRPPENLDLMLLRLWQVATSVISVSFVAAVLLGLLAWKERKDRQARDRRGDPDPKQHGRLHLIAMVTTTSWMAIFLTPLLLFLYYWDRVLTVAFVIVPAGWVLWLCFRLNWYLRPFLLLLAAFVIWLVLRRTTREGVSNRVSRWGRGNRRTPWTQWLSTLLIATGAPWIILLISVLEVLSFLPVGGETLRKWAQTLSEASYWNALKDIHMFLTDSSRSAMVRCLVIEGLEELAQEVDSIHILAHSLGTVIAYDTLVHLRGGDGACAEERGRGAPMSIDELCLSARVAGMLKGAGIESVEELSNNDDRLLAIPGFGAKSLEQVRASLKAVRKRGGICTKVKTLVTYGSPLNKIRILADSRAARKREERYGLDYWRFASGAQLPDDLGGGDFRWLNFYALEDVASDVCSRYSAHDDRFRPYEFSTWSAKDLVTAHGAYFTDRGFWNTILEAMGIVYDSSEMRRIEKVLIKEKDLEALRGAGVVTQWQLLERGATPDLREMLEKETGISSDMILSYAHLADLVRVPGIDEESADLLTLAGVGTLQRLKGENASDLHQSLEAVEGKFQVEPSLEDVKRWIDKAETLSDIVTP